MRTLYSFSNFLLGVYYGGLFYWFFNGNMEQWLGFLVLFAAGIALYLTLSFVICSILEKQSRAAAASRILFGGVTCLLYLIGFILIFV